MSQGGSINDIMINAMKTNWALTDDFQITIQNIKRPLVVKGTGMSVQDVLDVSIMNVDLPQLGSTVESVMQAGEWRIYNAKFEPFSFSITFRDFGGLDLRNYFSAVWMDAQRGYFDDVKSKVTVSLGGKLVFESADCLITSVSTVQLDNSNSQIAEFSVEFSSPYYTNAQIKEFGTDAYRSSKHGSSASPGGSGFGGFGSSGGSGNFLGGLSDVISTIKSW